MDTKNEAYKKLAAYFLILLLLALIAQTINMETYFFKRLSSNEFNEEQWRSAPIIHDKMDDSTRYDMVYDLLWKDPLTGKTRDEVLQLLGNPNLPFDSSSVKQFVYPLAIAEEHTGAVLLVDFGEDGLVEELDVWVLREKSS